ncbi:kinase-like domain-containing protein [Xylariaceae sp. FL0662B]|nr:kinase-like domain-containing protein [Xylariaceae sp. FL0662B]
MASVNREEIKSKVLHTLKGTSFAVSTLEPLTGGTGNFIYRGTLLKALEDDTKEILVKHSEGYVANSPSFKLTLCRCRVEKKCLKAMSKFPILGKTGSGSPYSYIVRTPKFYHFDKPSNTQVQEYLPNASDLKTYALNTYASPTPETLRRQCFQLGVTLGRWLRSFHDWAGQQPVLRKIVAANKEMQELKLMINFSMLIGQIKQSSHILGDAQRVLEEVASMATFELDNESQLQVIHGDFWTGNILLPNAPIEEGVDIPMFVIDWETAQLGVPSADIGQMIAELYELMLYKKINAGVWMVQGFTSGYGEFREDFAFRTAIQVGAHLICFGSVAGWGTPKEVEDVARIGKEIIMHARQKDRAWFEGGDLACLFRKFE